MLLIIVDIKIASRFISGIFKYISDSILRLHPPCRLRHLLLEGRSGRISLVLRPLHGAKVGVFE